MTVPPIQKPVMRFIRQLSLLVLVTLSYCVCVSFEPAAAETLRHPQSLEKQLVATDSAKLALEARRRGDAKRGALLFYKSAAACASCHLSEQNSPLGPDLSELGQVTDQYVIESLLYPSKSIRKGYETYSILRGDGKVVSGLLVAQDERELKIRSATDLTRETIITMDDVESMKKSDKSMMPEGLVGSIGQQRDFLDLAKYVMEVAAGGPPKAKALKPTADQLAVKDDTRDLDHAGIIRSLRSRDFESGKGIYHGYCFNCHGNDGNTPSLPTARAFGTQKMKFGSDPYRMFMTLSRGNGLMAPMSHLTPKERYQVVHYIREQFMKPSNPDYFPVDKPYLAELPKGTENGTRVDNVLRDYGPALASQLKRDFSSVLTVKLDAFSISYDLHSMNQAGVWRGGFLDLSNTQHVRDRGEGTANPLGEMIPELAGWQWGHDGSLDYSRDSLSPRSPMPKYWMTYHGHYLSGPRVAFRYAIDGREIIESHQAGEDQITHSLEIGPGDELVLSVAKATAHSDLEVHSLGGKGTKKTAGDASDTYVASLPKHSKPGDESNQGGVAVAAIGQVAGLRWTIDEKKRIVLRIPKDSRPRTIAVVRRIAVSRDSLGEFSVSVRSAQKTGQLNSPAALTQGGPLLWPEEIHTTGTLGLESGGYALDRLTIPDETPWNTWFRTSALDFFPDGRMVVATYGGDVWIVSGIDNELLDLRWKRFAGGLYEPMGTKVVGDKIYVTCKDRLTRLHDQDGNGEADFYESFHADPDVSVNFHAFNFDLQVDPDGYLYYAKSGHGADTDIPGAVFKVSPDGRRHEVFCTGFRTPNGMGMLPGGIPVNSDNQGQWTPASKINVLKKGGFYGWVQTYSIPGMWEPGGGSIDVKKVVPPTTFDPPLVWMPQEFDSSSGGQLWVDDPRWGPLSNHLVHTSFGKGWMYYAMPQQVGDIWQAAIIKLPYNFQTGIMRARVNPADGQVYATGLQGWNGGGRIGLADKGIERLRYRGKEHLIVSDCKVEPDGLRITFNFPIDPQTATDTNSYALNQWNYHWRAAYGSDRYSPSTDEVGIEKLNVQSVTLSDDQQSVKLKIAELNPVHQVHVLLKIKTDDGKPFEEEIYWTINQVPE